MNDLFTAIPSVGFPIVVAWYLLTRIEKGQGDLKESIDKNTAATNKLVEEVGRLSKRK